jgi:nifR3 family TIM-barrel protein
MEGVTDLLFRRLVRQIGGCGLFVTEFIPALGLTKDVPVALKSAEFAPDEYPISIQIYGREPELMAEAARYVQDLGPTMIDLNMGCPSKQVVKRSGGSALMREPEQARRVIRAMRAATELPFTVKMRGGWDHEMRNAPEVARMCEDEGVEGLSVHWRTRADGYKGERRLDIIAEVVDQVSVPVFANGDIVDVESARSTRAATGCAGLMIGRGAIRDPWVFERIRRDECGLPPIEVGADEKERVLLGCYAAIRDDSRTDLGALGRMKRISRYFAGGLPDGAALRQSIFHSQEVDQAIERVRAYFERLRAREQALGRPLDDVAIDGAVGVAG